MKRYPKYKDSGVEWLGKIPEHWEVVPAFVVFKEQCSRNKNLAEKNLLSLSYGKIVRKDFEANFGLLPESFETYQIVMPGNIILRLTDLQNDKKSLRVGLVKERGIITSAYLCLQPKNIYEKYVYTLLHNYDILKVFYNMGNGIRQNMAFKDLKRLPILVPTVEEQKHIDRFLDRKLEQIDHFISNKQRLIELLKEQKTAIINRAVTKGLNPHAHMKPSGIEWLGEIPADWEVTKIKYVSSMISKGTTPSTVGDEIIEQGPIRFLKAENILDGTISLNPEFFISAATNETLKRSKLKLNDVLFVIAGATLGKVALVTYTNLPANTNQAVAFIRTTQQVVPEFLIYWFQSSFIKELIWLSAVQSAQPNLSMEDLGNFPIPLPAKTLQQQLLDYLDSKCSQLNQAIAKIEKEIELIQEYRTTLISDAVTGKIDIRDTSIIETILTTTAN